jgi:hypothetical protein
LRWSRYPGRNPVGQPRPATLRAGPGVVIVQGARLIPSGSLPVGRGQMRRVARGCVGDYGMVWAGAVFFR